MGRLEDRYRRTLDKYRHSLALLHKKLNSMEQHEIKEQEKWKKKFYNEEEPDAQWFAFYHRGRECVIADIRDDVMNILNHTKEDIK